MKSKDKSSNIGNFYICNVCPYKTKFILLIESHVNKHIKSESSPKTINCVTELEKYKCLKCDYETHFLMKLRKHICLQKCVEKHTSKQQHAITQHRDTEGVKWFKCGHCPHKSKQKGNLKLHILHKHTVDLSQREVALNECEYCSFKTKYNHNLKQHILGQHTSLKKFLYCEYCPYKTKSNDYLKDHILWKHTSPESTDWLQCEYCSFKTKINSNLKDHAKRRH